MKAYYIRVSTIEQNTERQEYSVPEGYKVFKDKCSGSIPFKERTAGGVLFKHILKNEVEELKVHSIDRLGRDTLDIMNTIQISTSKGVNVVSHKEGLQTLIDGKENPTAKLMIGILATLSEFEKNRINERQQEGIARAKERGVYKTNGGNKKVESESVFLNKPKVKTVLKYLQQGESVRRCAKLSGCSVSLVQKVKKLQKLDKKEKALIDMLEKAMKGIKEKTPTKEKKGEWMPLPTIDKKNKPLKEFISSWSSCVVGGVNYEEANRLYSALPVELKKDKTLQALIDTYIARKDRYFIDVSKLKF